MATESSVLANVIASNVAGNGSNPSFNGNVTDRILYNQFIQNFYGNKLYVDGFMCTSRVQENLQASSIRVPLIAPPPFAPRTISIIGADGKPTVGTPNNDGASNQSGFYEPQSEGVEIPFTQIYDKGIRLFKILQNMVTLDHLGELGKQIPKAVAMMDDCHTLAVQLNAALAYAGTLTDSTIIVEYDAAQRFSEGYVTDVMNEALGKLYDPNVPYEKGVVSYAQDDMGILMTNEWKRILMTKGAYIINSDIGQDMLLKGVTRTGEVVGGGMIVTPIDGVRAKILPTSYLKFASQYLYDPTIENEKPKGNLPASTFAGVLAVIATSDSTGIGRLDTYVGFEKDLSSGTPGTIIQNLWQWGANVVREFAIALIVKKGFVNPNADGTAKLIVAPSAFTGITVSAPAGASLEGKGLSMKTGVAPSTGINGAGGTYAPADKTVAKKAAAAAEKAAAEKAEANKAEEKA